MPMPPFDLAQANRWFGIEFNNAAWELVEAPSRTADETERILRLAHASCLHWESVGTPANEQRGLILLAMAHAVAGLGTRAVTLAERCLAVGKVHDETHENQAVRVDSRHGLLHGGYRAFGFVRLQSQGTFSFSPTQREQ